MFENFGEKKKNIDVHVQIAIDGNLNGGRIIFLKDRNNFSYFPCRWKSVGGYGVIEKMEN